MVLYRARRRRERDGATCRWGRGSRPDRSEDGVDLVVPGGVDDLVAAGAVGRVDPDFRDDFRQVVDRVHRVVSFLGFHGFPNLHGGTKVKTKLSKLKRQAFVLKSLQDHPINSQLFS